MECLGGHPSNKGRASRQETAYKESTTAQAYREPLKGGLKSFGQLLELSKEHAKLI